MKCGNVATDQLRSYIERIEKLTGEREAITGDINEIMAEAVANGFDRKAIREIIKLRKLDSSERDEQEHVLDTYLRALGMTPEFDEE